MLKFDRVFTTEGKTPESSIEWVKDEVRIYDSDGSVIFELKDGEYPKDMSPMARSILASKYFRKAGVPQDDGTLGSEKSYKQTVRRMTSCWRHWGESAGYFDSKNGEIFEEELAHMLLHQMVAPNSPQWFNTGLSHSYKINGPAQGHYYVDEKSGVVKKSKDSYTRPQPHACFIQAINDDLVNGGGIMDLFLREARLFKYGSGTGTNFSSIRASGEPLSGGGKSSGLMSFLKIGDTAAGAIKSGGTTRRAAKMICLDLDHPDIVTFIEWKEREEKKAKILIEAGYPADFNGEAYQTISGQNSNNSIRIPHEFFDALEEGKPWNLYYRTELEKAKLEKRDPKPVRNIDSEELLDKIAKAAWSCADPGVQYDGVINDWHTCPEGGKINASNPCSEYMFLDDTACNLASLNLEKFYDNVSGKYNIDQFKHAVRLWTVVLEISVLMAQFPSKEIALRSYQYRTLGLGYANLGVTLMLSGIPYNSPKARAIAGSITSIMTGCSYEVSAEMAEHFGAFEKFKENKQHMLRVIRNHRRAAYDSSEHEYENLKIKPIGISSSICPDYLLDNARKVWDSALLKGEEFGYRNAQVTVIAPTGTIGILMDCDTTGIEPEFAIVKSKKLAGGGYYKIVNKSVPSALKKLGYTVSQRNEIMMYILGTNTLPLNGKMSKEELVNSGFTVDEVKRLQDIFLETTSLTGALIRINKFKNEKEVSDFVEKHYNGEISEFYNDSVTICGAHTLEGAPHIKNEHLEIFDCANICGIGSRFIPYEGHIKMMAAVQPFISGAISKTINMPEHAEVEDIRSMYTQAWKLGLKAVAVYRDGSKGSQILTSKIKNNEKEDKVIEKIEVTQVEDKTKKLSPRRRGFTYELVLGGQKMYIRTGETDNAECAEVFMDMFKEGTDYRTLLSCFAVLFSKALKAGIPLAELIDTFKGVKMHPAGPVGNHPYIKMASSPIDLLVRVLGMEYLNDFTLGTIKEQNGVVLGPPAAGPYKTTHGSIASHGEKMVQDGANVIEILKKSVTKTQAAKAQVATKIMMGEEKLCNNCGHSMTPNGGCWKCDNCGNTTGCSG